MVDFLLKSYTMQFKIKVGRGVVINASEELEFRLAHLVRATVLQAGSHGCKCSNPTQGRYFSTQNYNTNYNFNLNSIGILSCWIKLIWWTNTFVLFIIWIRLRRKITYHINQNYRMNELYWILINKLTILLYRYLQILSDFNYFISIIC